LPIKYIQYMKDLPVMPEVASKILSIAEDSLDISFKELENIIKVDPGLTAKILKIANSALYARQREIKNLQMAITLLGFKNIKSLVLLVTASNFFLRMKKSVFHNTFWKHSLITAFFAKNIAIRCRRNDMAEEAFLSGLLHDIGQAVFFNYDSKKYMEILKIEQETGRFLEKMEKNEFGSDHREVGAAILEKWNFPRQYFDTAMEHASLNITSPHKSLVITISVADLLAEKLGFGVFTDTKRELYEKILPYSCLKKEDAEYYETNFFRELKKDTLFHDCQALFGIK